MRSTCIANGAMPISVASSRRARRAGSALIATPARFFPARFQAKAVLLHLITTTLVGVAVAGAVALFQTAMLPSGH